LSNGNADLLYNTYRIVFDEDADSYAESQVQTYLAGLIGDSDTAYFERIPKMKTFQSGSNDPEN
jgi:hypothetical protein